MDTLFVGQNFIEFQELDSTNDYAETLLKEAIPEGTVVLANHQTRGKGQNQNIWYTEAGLNLTFSLIFYPKFLPATDSFYLNKIISLSIYRLISNYLPQKKVAVKWPNDVLVEGEKISGILIRNQIGQSGIKNSIVGVGLNVNQIAFSRAYGKASSLHAHTSEKHDLKVVLDLLLGHIEAYYLKLKSGKKDSIDKEYLDALYAYQEEVDLKVNGKREKCRIAGVDKAGRLALDKAGKLSFYQMKEVEFIL